MLFICNIENENQLPYRCRYNINDLTQNNYIKYYYRYILNGAHFFHYIYGLFCPKESVNDKTKPNFWIKKSHDLNLDKIMQENAEFECYFIMSERNDAKVHNLIKQKYRKYSNVLIFKYDEIKDTTNDILLPKITNNVFNKIKHFLPDELITHDDICKKNMQKRIKDMNKKYEEIKDKPFSYFDTFYHIHGSHKNR